MSPGETVGACIATAAGLYLIATYGWDAWHKRRTHRRFQATAKQAARAPRTKATVAEDVANKKAAREQTEAAADLTTCLAILDITPHDIPHQARRTEEDQ